MLVIQTAAALRTPDTDFAEIIHTPESVPAPVNKSASPASGPTVANSPTLSANDGERIKELLEDVQPHTWVFTGDNLGFQAEQARRGWIEHFSDFIHEKIERKQDIILNSSIADSSIHPKDDTDFEDK